MDLVHVELCSHIGSIWELLCLNIIKTREEGRSESLSVAVHMNIYSVYLFPFL